MGPIILSNNKWLQWDLQFLSNSWQFIWTQIQGLRNEELTGIHPHTVYDIIGMKNV